MLFADMDPATIGLYSAITGLLVAAGNYIQSVLKDRKDRQVARDKAAADKAALEATAKTLAEKTDRTAQAITEKVETVHKAVNGEGLGGKLDEAVKKIDALAAWQRDHDAQDNQRHDEMLGRILGLKVRPPEGKP